MVAFDDYIQPATYRVKIQPLPDTDLTRGSEPHVNRGVVASVGPGVLEDETDEDRWPFVKPGAIVYYRGGFKIGHYVFCECDHRQIIGYEEE